MTAFSASKNMAVKAKMDERIISVSDLIRVSSANRKEDTTIAVKRVSLRQPLLLLFS
jgi:hypothetical protein